MEEELPKGFVVRYYSILYLVFIIDTTIPEVYVSWDNLDSHNGRYYNKNRTAQIRVVEKNFDSSLFSIAGTDISNWVNDGDVHTASVLFEDGEHELSISGKDLANHSIRDVYNSGVFIVDTKNPEIFIDGVTDGVSYRNDVGFDVVIRDDYLDGVLSNVTLEGKNHDSVNIEGELKDGVYTFSHVFDTDESVDDAYVLKVTAVDNSGNSFTKELKFIVNRTGSVYDFSNKSEIGSYLNGVDDIEIVESNIDRLDLNKIKVVVTLDGKNIEVPSDCLSITEVEKNGRYYYTYRIDKSVFDKDGKYLIQVYSATDDGVEYTSVAEEYSFVIDKTPPTIVISGVENGKNYKGSSRKVSIEVRDSSGISSVIVYVNGNKVDTYEESGLYNVDIPEKEGSQSILVEVIDIAGNKSSLEVKDFKISSTVESYIENQSWIRVVVIIAILIIVILILILLIRIGKGRKNEKRLAKENERYFTSKGTTSGNISGSNSVDDKTDVIDSKPDDSKTDLL